MQSVQHKTSQQKTENSEIISTAASCSVSKQLDVMWSSWSIIIIISSQQEVCCIFINIFVEEDVQEGYIAGFYHNINVIFFYPFGNSTLTAPPPPEPETRCICTVAYTHLSLRAAFFQRSRGVLMCQHVTSCFAGSNWVYSSIV